MKKSEYSVAGAAERFAKQYPEGEPFTTSELLSLGTRAAVDQALSRMSKTGVLERVVPGIYVRPRSSKYVSKVMPTSEKVARATARATGSVIEVHGAEAAREFGFTTQVPMQPIFVTSGRSRTIEYGASTIVLRHASPKHMLFAGQPAGRAFAALLYLGKSEVTNESIEKIRETLDESEFEQLTSSSTRSKMPAWMSNAFHAYENAHEKLRDVA